MGTQLMDAAKVDENATLIPLASMETHVSGEITGQGLNSSKITDGDKMH
jgi:hypothetical protein